VLDEIWKPHKGTVCHQYGIDCTDLLQQNHVGCSIIAKGRKSLIRIHNSTIVAAWRSCIGSYADAFMASYAFCRKGNTSS
jgi:hypothetical protein